MDPKLTALITAVTFGMSPVALKLAYRNGGKTDAGMVIGLAVAIPLNLVLVPFIAPGWDRLTLVAWAAFIAGGLAGAAIGRRFIYESINLLGASRAATIRSSSPVLTAFLAVLLYQEDISPVRWGAILAIVGGAALVSWDPREGARGWMAIGVLYALGAAAAYGLRPLFLKLALEQSDAPLAGSIIGAVAALLWSVITDRPRLDSLRPDRGNLWFFIGGITQTVALLALTFGLNEGDVSLVYSLTASAPLFTLVFTWIFLRGVERVDLRLVIGAALVVAGVIYL